MFSFNDTQIHDLALHHVGNQFNEEPLILGKTKLSYNEEVEDHLLTYFLSSFKENEYFNLHHETDLGLNEVYNYASAIFDSPEELQAQSASLAKHLYENSTHPKVKGGEFYVVYFKSCILEGEVMDAIGLFKSENKDTFLKIRSGENGFEINSQQGFNINKLDKGCIIFNTERESGYVLSVIDNTNKGSDAKFWFDHFLHVQQRQDEYFQTENVIRFAKEFITKELPEQFESSKADQVHLLNKSAQYFKEQEEFDLSEFANIVIEQPEIIDSFNEYKSTYSRERAVPIDDSFQISDSAVKKKSRVFKSVIKLDKNFHIYVHGNRDLIERHTDEDGRRYYKLFFEEEN
jgi:hypothetical protein